MDAEEDWVDIFNEIEEAARRVGYRLIAVAIVDKDSEIATFYRVGRDATLSDAGLALIGLEELKRKVLTMAVEVKPLVRFGVEDEEGEEDGEDTG